MFSSLRSRLWLSYAFIIATALGLVAVILFVYLIRNPLSYRQTLERLQAVQTIVAERGNVTPSQPMSVSAVKASHTFNVRILLFSQDKQLTLDTYADNNVVLPFPPERRILRKNAASLLVRDENKVAWLYSLEQLSDGSYLMVAAPRPRIYFGCI